MAIHLKSFCIDGFRGITDLNVEALSHINIIVGDNNSGKTSVLESLMMFECLSSPSSIYNVARLRDKLSSSYYPPVFEGFLNLFCKEKAERNIIAQGVFDKFEAGYQLSGEVKKISIDPAEKNLSNSSQRKLYYKNRSLEELSNVSAFQGRIVTEINGRQFVDEIELNEYMRVSHYKVYRKNNKELPEIHYLSPIAHITEDNFSEIIRNDAYKDICIEVLKLFDPQIKDLLLLKAENSNGVLEYIKHETYGNMPIGTYGDGVKKVISLANAIAKSKDGILLIDEIETAMHSKYYYDIFSFITKAALQFQVQIFMTTHNLEAIDGFLNVQDYDKTKESEKISVITFKKEKEKTYARVLSGRRTYENRSDFDFEVRL